MHTFAQIIWLGFLPFLKELYGVAAKRLRKRLHGLL